MTNKNLDIRSSRMLLADWFSQLAIDAGLDLTQQGTSGDSFTLGSSTGFNVRAEFIEEQPYLRFVSSDPKRDELVGRVASEAISRVTAMDFGGEVWYSTELHELPWTIASPQFMSTLLERLGRQTRIVGWRRLGGNVLLEFTEDVPEEGDGTVGLLAPKAAVKVHIAAPGPKAGHFASHIAHGVVELVGSICTFALGRPVGLPHAVFATERSREDPPSERRADTGVLTLARKSVPLDIMSWAGRPGGLPVFARLRSALLTFDAAVRQENDAVASILYIVAAECLTTPSQPWRTERLTKRFREFYDEMMPHDLDEIVRHGNFEEAIGVRRGSRTPRALRREALDRIYSFRSGQLHEGLTPSYQGLLADPVASVRRGLLSDFAEAAILNFILAPRSSLIGHPLFAEALSDGIDC